ncbi:MAG TPA: DUF4040 domain-containing protein [Tepidisphaeraceae bacterium]|jgi:uncharacterized MnhB-related membrane protein
MQVIEIAILIFIALTGTAVVMVRDPAKQVIAISYFGIVLSVMFLIFQAPDVSLSQIVIGTVGLPMMILLCLAKLKRDEQLRQKEAEKKG